MGKSGTWDFSENNNLCENSLLLLRAEGGEWIEKVKRENHRRGQRII